MKNTKKKQLDRLDVETAAIEGRGKIAFLYAGLSQKEVPWTDDTVAGAAQVVLEVQKHFEVLTEHFYQTFDKNN